MKKRCTVKPAVALLLGVFIGTAGCEVGPHSGRGLRLPSGDLEAGQIAFAELGCSECHDLVGEPGPPVAEGKPPLLTIGGLVSRIETHGELVTSIVNPSHGISERFRGAQSGVRGSSRMPSINERMTVAQLIDVTEYVQSKYDREFNPEYIR